MFIVSSPSSPLFFIHSLLFTLLSLSYSDLFQVCYSLCIIFTHFIITSICFICLLIDIIFTLGTLRSMAHKLFCTCCILYIKAWVLIIGYLGLVSLYFYYPSLRYVPCLKTTLRHQMSSSIAPTWTGIWDLVNI